ncbi:Anthranilate phosphoribosyltransferase [Pyrodictium delaneyi]|uniref:Anthranilate phosphoribosyltransferase n=1 Tax=Pyrodictium delaneyi TaxID=1273541 RepID=A0A0N7JD22_9CREN|nr:anthranilate phosphoribosyltransferase [Pyrodictium delaneyi]ALL00985.1 Anthranilate phosphoribosyltransferase [Pyrodictium delaneyi]
MQNEGIDLPRVLEALLSGAGIGFHDARKIAAAMLSGGLDDVSIAAILVALRAYGETPDIVAGFATALREACERVDVNGLDPIDTAGTGGDGSHTLNASTSAALIAASLGVPVLKHGNRSVSSRSGSADFLEALGYRIDHGPREAECMLTRVGFAFLYAPRYHPAMKRVMPIRRRLGIRTVFNLVGPLANPGMIRRQVLGVARPELLDVMVSAGAMLGYERLLVVHGEPGIDEVSVSGETIVYELNNGVLEKYTVEPEDLGLKRYNLRELQVETPSESVERFLAVIHGGGRPSDRDFIAANAAAALYAAGRVKSLRDGVEAAIQALEDGTVAGFINKLREACQQCCGQS